MKKILAKAGAILSWLYNHLGDSRSKNALIFILLLLTAFGIVAPEQATSLRDTILKMAL
jgi:hypothetical protein